MPPLYPDERNPEIYNSITYDLFSIKPLNRFTYLKGSIVAKRRVYLPLWWQYLSLQDLDLVYRPPFWKHVRSSKHIYGLSRGRLPLLSLPRWGSISWGRGTMTNEPTISIVYWIAVGCRIRKVACRIRNVACQIRKLGCRIRKVGCQMKNIDKNTESTK